METIKSESPEAATLGSQNGTEKATGVIFPHGPIAVNSARFLDLLERRVSRLTVRGCKATGLCPLHPDQTPSFSADLEKLVWYCFACARGGGVKAFALAVGEPWGTIRLSTRERARFAVQARRREAEGKAREILTRRKDERDDSVWSAWCEANMTATGAAELLGLFSRHPALAEEFPHLVKITESDYSAALWRKMLIEQRYAGEVAL